VTARRRNGKSTCRPSDNLSICPFSPSLRHCRSRWDEPNTLSLSLLLSCWSACMHICQMKKNPRSGCRCRRCAKVSTRVLVNSCCKRQNRCQSKTRGPSLSVCTAFKEIRRLSSKSLSLSVLGAVQAASARSSRNPVVLLLVSRQKSMFSVVLVTGMKRSPWPPETSGRLFSAGCGREEKR